MGNAYMNKQKKQREEIIQAAQDIASQFIVDCMISAMRENNKVSKNAVKEILAEFEKKRTKYIVCFDPKHPEADYYRELLDRDQKEVFGAATKLFDERYPFAYDIRYDKPLRNKERR